jgi:hypothetical protein
LRRTKSNSWKKSKSKPRGLRGVLQPRNPATAAPSGSAMK